MSPSEAEDMRRRAREIARTAAGGKNQPPYCETPATFEPHDWVIDAVIAAMREGYDIGYRNGKEDGQRDVADLRKDGES